MELFGGSLLQSDDMQRNRPRSLRLRLGLALGGITALALFSMVASIWIAETARGDAAAINQAGSLRMQSYKIAALLRGEVSPKAITESVERFEAVLESPELRGLAGNDGDAVSEAYAEVTGQWEQTLRPDLGDAANGAEGPGPERYLARVDAFVESVDAMVQALQHQAETRIQRLRLIQGVAIFFTLMLVLASISILHSGVVIPFRDLMRAADRLRRGDLSARARHTAPDEIGVLGHSFNTMAANLEHLHGNLEREVEHKTRALSRSNEALKLLLDTARNLTPGRLNSDTITPVLQRLEVVLGAGPVSVCIAQPRTDNAFQTFSSVPAHEPVFGQTAEGRPCLASQAGQTQAGTRPGVASVPLEHQGECYGVLLLEYPPGSLPDNWKFRLAEAVADQIAFAQALTREARQQRRLALMEERAVIARELHDSLAQSLSYLKIQVARLQALLGQQSTNEDTDAIVAELREGLNTAYGHLRELLNTFRLKMNEPGLHPALEATVREFRERAGGPDIRLKTVDAGLALSSNAEIHVLQIVREALANVVNHANARHASVSLEREGASWVRLCVEDDGRGMPDNPEKAHHYGIDIMAERAQSLEGTLDLTPTRPQGTRLEVRFPSAPNTDAATAEAIT